MCFGVPMQVQAVDGLNARCVAGDRIEDVSLALVGDVPLGSYVLVYLGSAARKLDPIEAAQITDAIHAIDAASKGQAFEHLLQDLIDREPELPAHLQSQMTQNKDTREDQNDSPLTADTA